YPMFEAELEKVVRRHVRRGTLLVQVRVERQAKSADLSLNIAALKTYLRQIRAACEEAGTPEFAGPLLAGVLGLPGVAPEGTHFGPPPDDEWPVVEKTLDAALRHLDAMRRDEGRAMANELLAHHRGITEQLSEIRRHLPAVMTEYRQRL